MTTNEKESIIIIIILVVIIFIMHITIQMQNDKIETLEQEIKGIDSVSVVTSIEADSLVFKIRRFKEGK